MDAAEVRFRILFEYYRSLYMGNYDVTDKIGAIVADGREKYVAKIWLIDEGYVKGVNRADASGTVYPIIDRINSNGINLVESVMNRALTETKGQDGGFDSLSKAVKIKRFAAECLSSPVAGTLCKAAYEAIAAFMR